MSGRPVPWASWNEWHGLRDDLLSADPFRQEAGLQQVCAWRLRGKLPLGVDTTAHLLDARRADNEWQRAVAWAAAAAAAARTATRPHDTSPADAAVAAGELPLRLRYSLPLIRLVNGISDSQQRGRVASSVAVLSDAAGLPRALVDVRHEATHNELPSLPLLRAAADSALAWLRDNYWDGQCRALVAAAERIGSLLACLAESWRAAMAAGMSGSACGLAVGEDEEDEEGPEGGEAAVLGSYSGAEGQRLRRQAMSELRSIITPAFTQELLQPVLDCPVLLPPKPPHAQPTPAPQQPKQQVEEMAWRSAMKQLLKWYPRLRPLLLQAALRRLVAACHSPSPSSSSGPPADQPRVDAGRDSAVAAEQQAQNTLRWVLRLLPAAASAPVPSSSSQAARLDSPTRRQQQGRPFGPGPSAPGTSTGPGKASRKAAALAAAAAAGRASGLDGNSTGGGDGDGEPSLDGPLAPQQLQELLSIAVAGIAAESEQDREAEARGGAPLDGGAGAARAAGADGARPDATRAHACGAAPRTNAEPLGTMAGLPARAGPQLQYVHEAVAALRRAVAMAGGSRGSKRQRPISGGTGEDSGRTPADDDGGGVDGSSGGVEGAGGSAEGLGAGNSRAGAAGGGSEGQLLQQEGHRQRLRRWTRCDDWTRCAIGCLPCPLNANGRIPPLEPWPAHYGAPAAMGPADDDVADVDGPVREGVRHIAAPYMAASPNPETAPEPASLETKYFMETSEAEFLPPLGGDPNAANEEVDGRGSGADVVGRRPLGRTVVVKALVLWRH